mmetsp:Transcript_133795/g.416142  ORF Transcript_133795/g.416142 Transcript_133795/m.416142 type:complete len:91 (+) Transcript_133795:193-465(+)
MQAVLGSLPGEVVDAISAQPGRGRREALLALNCYVHELSGPPRRTPASQQLLLRALCGALRGLEEGGEVETLLLRLSEALRDTRVHPEHV